MEVVVRSAIVIDVPLAPMQVVLPHVVRYLEPKYVDEFFELGRLRISTCKKFWDHKDEERGDEHESLIRASGVHGDGGKFNGSVVASTDCIVLSTSCVEDLEEGAKLSSGYTSAIRIIDPINFAMQIARAIPGYNGAFQSQCIYRDSRHLELEDFAQHFPSSTPPSDEAAAIAHVKRLNEYLGSRVTCDALLRKGLKYRNQNEYRFVWFTPEAEGKEFLDVVALDARQFCRRVTTTPAGPDLTVDIMGAKMTMLTRFDPNDPDGSLKNVRG